MNFVMDGKVYNAMQDTLADVFTRAKAEKNDVLIVEAAKALIALETYKDLVKESNHQDSSAVYKKLDLDK